MLLQVPGIAQAVVDTYEPVPGTTELVGYYSLRTGAAPPGDDVLRAHLRDRLPPYMVPAYLEHLRAIPMTTSDKADRKALPPPGTRRTADGEFVAPSGPTETVLAELLAATLGVERVSTAAHFFDDLGANSLLLARFAAQVRAKTTLPPIAMRDMYLHPTVIALAALADAGAAVDAPVVPPAVRRPDTVRYLLCGAAQVVLFLVSVTAASALMVVDPRVAARRPDLRRHVAALHGGQHRRLRRVPRAVDGGEMAAGRALEGRRSSPCGAGATCASG